MMRHRWIFHLWLAGVDGFDRAFHAISGDDFWLGDVIEEALEFFGVVSMPGHGVGGIGGDQEARTADSERLG